MLMVPHLSLVRHIYQYSVESSTCINSQLLPTHLRSLLLRLGIVDKLGMSYEADFLTTGYGSHLALPILRNKWRAGLTAEEAKALLDECMRVLYVATWVKNCNVRPQLN